jgi:mono/diheme cytochrome c family protein
MLRGSLVIGFAMFGASVCADSQSVSQSARPEATTADPQTAIVKQYCTGCHSERGKAGGLSLASFDAGAAAQHAEVAEKMIRKLRAGMMPPPGARRPEESALLALASSLETRIDRAAAAAPNPGRRPFQRLNRVEYARAVKDLLALDVDVSGLLPPDSISQGFDNVADSQPLSPALMEGYLRAASTVTALAVGNPDAESTEAHYRVPKTASQLRRVDGAPLGTRGGIAVVHTFPADGDYVFRIELHGNADGFLFGGPAAGEQIDLSINGERRAVLDIDPDMAEVTTSLFLKTPPIHVSAGPQRLAAAFVQRFEGPVNDLIAPIDHTLADTQIGVAYGITTLPHLKDLTIVGPQHVTGVSSTPSRERIFACRPTAAADEAACASRIITGLAAQAFRHPPSRRDLDALTRFYADGRKERDFESGIAAALEAILASPQFVFRVESAAASAAAPVDARGAAARPPAARAQSQRALARPASAPLDPPKASARQAGTERVSNLALASRLSFFLWATGPDAELTKVARQGRLTAPGVLEHQIERMLADPRAESLSTRFAAQWLRLNDVDGMLPDAVAYPYYDHTLGQAFVRETELFFQSIVRDDRSVLDLITADYSYVNDRIARHYGIANVTGPEFRRVALPETRRGLLGQGSILVLTSVADRTSPVMRGKWIMEVLLGSPPPPPPPNVPALEATNATSGGKVLSTRERMEEHRKNPACVSCHRVIDPLGLALDNFDVTGKWRIKDNGVPVDAAGVMYDGTKLDGPAALRDALLKHRDVVLQTFTENLMTYALGRRVEYFDMPAVRAIIRQAEKSDLHFSSFVLGIVDSAAFQRRAIEPPQTTARNR